jgi:putative sterol carrier protein
MASAAVQALADDARKILAGQPSLGGNICGDFGADGVVYLYGQNNTVAVLNAPAAADCTIALSLTELADLEGGASIVWAVIWGEVTITGDMDLAKKLGGLIQAAAQQSL